MDVVKRMLDEKAQMHTMEAAVAALLMVGAVMFVIVAMPPGLVTAPGHSEAQLEQYGWDALSVLGAIPGDDGYGDMLQYYISTGNFFKLDEHLRRILPDNVEYNIVIHDFDAGRMPATGAVTVFNLVSVGGVVYEIRMTLWYI